MTQHRRKFLAEIAALSAAVTWPGLAAAATPGYDFSPAQSGRIRTHAIPEDVRLLSGIQLVQPGAFTVAVSPFGPPVATYASDARTVIGADPDFSQLVADALGLKFVPVVVAWPAWPLGLTSGKYDAVISNIGVTEQRKQKYDFSTYRLGLHGFFVADGSAIQSISETKDIAGLRVITGSGTIQERILLEWNQQNLAHGLKPVALQYFDNLPAALLGLASGRADAIFAPRGPLEYIAATQGKLRLVGTVNAGWPLRADVAIATRKGSGLAQVLTKVTNDLIASGQYRAALARWGVEDEALSRSETNPPGYKDA